MLVEHIRKDCTLLFSANRSKVLLKKIDHYAFLVVPVDPTIDFLTLPTKLVSSVKG